MSFVIFWHKNCINYCKHLNTNYTGVLSRYTESGLYDFVLPMRNRVLELQH